MNLKVLIIDDMPLSRQRVRRYLLDEVDVDIVGECSDTATASQAIAELSPNLLILDVQMPGDTGLALLQGIPAKMRPAAIVITAFDEYAVQAFAVQVVDYLLKPFSRERLTQALAKAREQFGRASPSAASVTEPYLERIAIKSVGRTVFVATSAIDWIETAGNYLCLHMGAKSQLLRGTMNHIEVRLDPHAFVRIHRSTMARIAAVRELQPLSNGDQAVILHDGTQLVLSRSYREKAMSALGLP